MTVKRLLAIFLIVGCTSAAWFLLGGTVQYRSSQTDGRLGSEVVKNWGPLLTQEHPSLFYEAPTGASVRRDIQPETSDISVALTYEPKQKGCSRIVQAGGTVAAFSRCRVACSRSPTRWWSEWMRGCVQRARRSRHAEEDGGALMFSVRFSVASNKNRFDGSRGIEGIGVPPSERPRPFLTGAETGNRCADVRAPQ